MPRIDTTDYSTRRKLLHPPLDKREDRTVFKRFDVNPWHSTKPIRRDMGRTITCGVALRRQHRGATGSGGGLSVMKKILYCCRFRHGRHSFEIFKIGPDTDGRRLFRLAGLHNIGKTRSIRHHYASDINDTRDTIGQIFCDLGRSKPPTTMGHDDNRLVDFSNQVFKKRDLVTEGYRRTVRQIRCASGQVDGVTVMPCVGQLRHDIRPDPATLPGTVNQHNFGHIVPRLSARSLADQNRPPPFLPCPRQRLPAP